MRLFAIAIAIAVVTLAAPGIADTPARAPQRPAGSEWVSRPETSPIDDSNGWTLTAYASEAVYSGGRRYKPELIIRCQENTTDIFVQYDEFIDRDGTQTEIRLDAGPAQSVWWQTSNDGVAVGQWGGAKSIPVIRQMMDHEKLTIRVEQFSGPGITAAFNITGLRQEITPLAEACHWAP